MITNLDIQRLFHIGGKIYSEPMKWLKLIGLNLSAQKNDIHSPAYISFM